VAARVPPWDSLGARRGAWPVTAAGRRPREGGALGDGGQQGPKPRTTVHGGPEPRSVAQGGQRSPGAARPWYRVEQRAWRVLAVLGVLAVLWALGPTGGAVMHGHPAYWVLLAVTAVASVASLSWQPRPRPTTLGWRRAGATALALGWVAWLAAILWHAVRGP
jgi:hypothetical protein